MGGECKMNVERKAACVVCVENPEGKRPLGRPRYGEEDDVKVDS